MIYNNGSIRRHDRRQNENNIARLLASGEYGILSMIEREGTKERGYGITLNYVWDGSNSIYFHCAQEGYKLQCLMINLEVSFCVIGKTKVISNKFTTAYESIVVRGRIHLGLSEDERRNALRMLIEKYSPDDLEIGEKYIEKSFDRTNVILLEIKEISGKGNYMKS